MGRAASQPRLPDAAIVFAAALLLYAPVLVYGMPYGHDGSTYAAWLDAFAQELGEGILYPRWLSSMGEGAGSSAFFFYPPLAYYLMAGITWLAPGADVFTRIGVGLLPFFVISGLGFYWAALPALGRHGAVAGAIVYLLLPYHYGVDLWFRGDAAEFAAYAWAPFCFGFLLRLDRGWPHAAGLALSFALMILTHLPTALILAVGLGVSAAWLAWSLRSAPEQPGGTPGVANGAKKSSAALLMRFAAAMAVGIALSALYLAPALTMQDITSMHRMWAERFRYDANFLFTSADPSRPPIQDALVLATAAVLLSAATLIGSPRLRRVLPLIAATLAVWFVMSPPSTLFWEMLPPLQKVQFPWRFGVLLDLALAGLAGLAIGEALRRRDVLRIALCAAAFCGVMLANGPLILLGHARQPPFIDPATTELIADALAARRDTAEYRPPTAPERAPLGPPLRVLSGDAEATVTRWRSRDIAFAVEAWQPSELLVRHYHVPYWQAAFDDGRRLAVAPATRAGLMKIAVPAGSHAVSLRMPFTPAERWGLALSLAGSLAWLVMLAAPRLARLARRGRMMRSEAVLPTANA